MIPGFHRTLLLAWACVAAACGDGSSPGTSTNGSAASDPVCDDGESRGSSGSPAATGGFEAGRFDGWMEEFAGPHSGQVVTSPVRCGAYAARFEWRAGDVGGPVGGYRAEVHDILNYIAPAGSENWYSFSTMIPQDWPDLDAGVVITQWHATPDLADGEVWRSPPLAIRYSGTRLWVTARHSAEKIQTANDGTSVDLYDHPGEFTKGVWHDWVFRVRWDHGDGGIVDAWLDGDRAISYRGPIGYNDDFGVWFKIGLYRGREEHPETLVIHHDEYRRSDTCEGIAPELCAPE